MARVVKRSAAEATKTRASRARQDASSPLPVWIPPQLSQPVEIAPSGPQSLHEIKLGGARCTTMIRRPAKMVQKLPADKGPRTQTSDQRRRALLRARSKPRKRR